MTYVLAEIGAKALYLLLHLAAQRDPAAELSRSKGYGEKAGLGTGLLLSLLGPIIWLAIPPKDANAEWHERKPWQRRQKPREAEMSGEAADSHHTAITKD